jgi:hypothetical protein
MGGLITSALSREELLSRSSEFVTEEKSAIKIESMLIN